MSSKLFDIYTKQLHSIFEKIDKILETLPTMTDDKFSFLLNELEINFKECEKKFQQMDFELLTIRSSIQKEKLVQSITNSRKIYENYQEKAYLLKDKNYKSQTTLTYENQSKAAYTKEQYDTSIKQETQNKAIQPLFNQNKPKETKDPSWQLKRQPSKPNEKVHSFKDEDSLESYRIAINDESRNAVAEKKEVSDNTNSKQKEKYSKNKLSKLYRGKLLLTQLNQKYPKLLKYGFVFFIILLFLTGMIISSNHINQKNLNRNIILRPEEIVANLNITQ